MIRTCYFEYSLTLSCNDVIAIELKQNAKKHVCWPLSFNNYLICIIFQVIRLMFCNNFRSLHITVSEIKPIKSRMDGRTDSRGRVIGSHLAPFGYGTLKSIKSKHKQKNRNEMALFLLRSKLVKKERVSPDDLHSLIMRNSVCVHIV